jgi:hypothetical protein
VAAIRESELPREAGIRGAAADVDASRWIEPMAVDQQHAKSWQRLAAPAPRWSGRVRAVFDIDLEPDQRIHPRNDCRYIGSRACAICYLGLPRKAED